MNEEKSVEEKIDENQNDNEQIYNEQTEPSNDESRSFGNLLEMTMWSDGKTVNESAYCISYLLRHKILFSGGSFFTANGRMTDEAPLRRDIFDDIKICAETNIPRKISNIVELLKLEALNEDFVPETDRIHLANGTLYLDGTFVEGKPEIVRNRLPIDYEPYASVPETWLSFLDSLLYPEDIPTLQEFIPLLKPLHIFGQQLFCKSSLGCLSVHIILVTDLNYYLVECFLLLAGEYFLIVIFNSTVFPLLLFVVLLKCIIKQLVIYLSYILIAKLGVKLRYCRVCIRCIEPAFVMPYRAFSYHYAYCSSYMITSLFLKIFIVCFCYFFQK